MNGEEWIENVRTSRFKYGMNFSDTNKYINFIYTNQSRQIIKVNNTITNNSGQYK